MIFNPPSKQHTWTFSALALLWAVSQSAVGANCLIDAEINDPIPTVSSTLSLARPLATAAAFEARCDALGLAELVIEIQPRQRLNVQLLIEHSQAESVELTVSAAGRDSNWLAIDPAPRRQNDLSAYLIDLSAGADLVPGDRRELLLEVRFDEGQIWVEIPVTLIVQQEAPLFHNRFEVDPVLGQFSYRLPPLLPAGEAGRADILILAAVDD